MRKGLKIMSIILIIMAVLAIVISAITLGGGTLFSTAGINMNAVTEEEQTTQVTAVAMGIVTIILGIFMLILGIFDLITGVMGLRGSKGDKRAAGKAKIMGLISLVLAAVTNVSTVVSTPSASTICSAIGAIGLQVAFVMLASRVQHEDLAA